MHGPHQTAAFDLVLREALYIDTWQWDPWAAVYSDDVCFWAPTWLDETILSDDPQRHVSHIYLVGKPSVQDRIWRIQSGMSAFSSPLPRTLHQITNLRTEPAEAAAGKVNVYSNWAAFTYRRQETHFLYGRYHHEIDCSTEHPKITYKKVILLNDYVDMPFDINSI